MRDRYELTGDVFDIEFRYQNIAWTTGDASRGENGFGGTPAFAGFTGDADDAPLQLIGSGTGSVASLDERSNIGQPGKFWFPITDGAQPGVSADNPLLPDVIDDTWHFQYTTTRADELVWSDPEVAVGYDYAALGDTRFRSFILPSGIGDGLFDLYLGDLASPALEATDLIPDIEYFFSDFGFLGGVDFFRIAGIETGIMLPTPRGTEMRRVVLQDGHAGYRVEGGVVDALEIAPDCMLELYAAVAGYYSPDPTENLPGYVDWLHLLS